MIHFQEVQRFTQWWLWVLLMGLGLLPIWGITKQLILGGKFGSHPMSNFGLILFSLLIYGMVLFIWSICLKTNIDENEIRIKFFPLTKKTIKWEEVESAEVVEYGFVGGFGIRLSPTYGTVYNISGNSGLALHLNDGKKVLIGTQKADELEKLIHTIFD